MFFLCLTFNFYVMSKSNHSLKNSISSSSSNIDDVIRILQSRKSCFYLKLKSLYRDDDLPDDKSFDFISTYSKYLELSLVIDLIKNSIY